MAKNENPCVSSSSDVKKSLESDGVNTIERIENSKSDYSHLYKNNSKNFQSSTQQRRETFFNQYKERHEAVFDKHRDLSELFEDTVIREGEVQAKEAMDEMEVEYIPKTRPTKRRVKFNVTRSQWFTDIPLDLEDKWVVKFCPQGSRRLVVANKRITKCFQRSGHLLTAFQSNLPGGGKHGDYSTQKSGLTVLDCILDTNTNTYYILDVLVWNSTSLIDCDAELRLFWISGKYLEFRDLFEPHGKDSYAFKVLPYYPAEVQTISSEINQYEFKYGLTCDGLLFFHKEFPYIQGDNPFVTWLEPFMLPEKFYINVPISYLLKKPPGYINLETHLENLRNRNMSRTPNQRTRKHQKKFQHENFQRPQPMQISRSLQNLQQNFEPMQISQPPLVPQPLQKPHPFQNPQPLQPPQPLQNPQPLQHPQPLQNPQPLQHLQPFQNPQPLQHPQPLQNPQTLQHPLPFQNPKPLQHPQPLQNPQPLQHHQPLQNPQPLQHSQPLQNPQPLQHPQPLQNPQPLQHPQPLQNPQPLQHPQPFQNPQPLQHPQPLQNPQPLQHPLLFQNPKPLQHPQPFQNPQLLQNTQLWQNPQPWQVSKDEM